MKHLSVTNSYLNPLFYLDKPLTNANLTHGLIFWECALAMINESCLTFCARHIEIQHCAIQEWHKAGHIVIKHIHGVINFSDDLTKPFGWVLHA